MKSIKLQLAPYAIVAALFAAANLATAQTETTVRTATTNTAGMITEFSPDTIVVRTERAPEPIRYSYTKTTTYTDETGAPVSIETVKSGLPVTVYYERVGDRNVASRVVVRRTTTTTTPPAPIAASPVETIKKTTTTTTTTTGK